MSGYFRRGTLSHPSASRCAAIREVCEEAGVYGKVIDQVGMSQFNVDGKAVRVRFYLMKHLGDVGASESRDLAWRSFEGALETISHIDHKALLIQAEKLRTGSLK